jgi:hypothetical protein
LDPSFVAIEQEPAMSEYNPPKRPSKRLAIFFDGTWNKPQSNTNVWRLYLMVAEHDADGRAQRTFYDEGVGTRWYYQLLGGLFGLGLAGNVRLGYRWLMQHYEVGDEVYIFGFSRGAFTARSLAGLIARCGLLKPNAPMGFWDVFARYKKGDAVRTLATLRYQREHGGPPFDLEDKILLENTWYRPNLVKMVGVWDTVGCLGLPFGHISGISRSALRFHDTHLSTTVENSFQALAVDEQRKPYWGILWTQFVASDSRPMQDDQRFVEQRWFSGAHCNVGGGYREDLVPQRPLAWLQDKATHCGLVFRGSVIPTDDEFGVATRDSYAEFLGGLYRLINWRGRYVRWVQSAPVKKSGGIVHTVNERIDESVFERCRRTKSYRPKSLAEWAQRLKLDLEDVIATPAKWIRYSAPVSRSGVEAENTEPPMGNGSAPTS